MGKINIKVLKALFKVVIDDIYYEIDGLYTYIKYLKNQEKRLIEIDKYKKKMDTSSTPKKHKYYEEGINLLLQDEENINNYFSILTDYQNAIQIRENRIDKLYKEISIIKKLMWFFK